MTRIQGIMQNKGAPGPAPIFLVRLKNGSSDPEKAFCHKVQWSDGYDSGLRAWGVQEGGATRKGREIMRDPKRWLVDRRAFGELRTPPKTWRQKLIPSVGTRKVELWRKGRGCSYVLLLWRCIVPVSTIYSAAAKDPEASVHTRVGFELFTSDIADFESSILSIKKNPNQVHFIRNVTTMLSKEENSTLYSGRWCTWVIEFLKYEWWVPINPESTVCSWVVLS